MDGNDRASGKSTPVVTLADIKLDPAQLAACEGAYRRGVHQALALAGDIADSAQTLIEARRQLTKAENHAFRLRFTRKDEGRLMLLDHIRQELSKVRKGASR
jgi:hypothetical protein